MRISTRQHLRSYFLTFLVVAGATGFACAAVWFAPLDSVSAIYMLLVLIAAVRFGTVPAIFAALIGAFLTSLFYPPLFSPLVFEPPQLVDLATSLLVALTVRPLAGRLRAQMIAAREREQQTALVYGLGRALAEAGDASEIFQLVADHLEKATAALVAAFMAGADPVVVRSGFDAATTWSLAGSAGRLLGIDAVPGETELRRDDGRWLFLAIGGGSARAVVVAALPDAGHPPFTASGRAIG